MTRLPMKIDLETQERYVDLIRGGGRPLTAARVLDVDLMTMKEYTDADPIFAAAIIQAEQEAFEAVEDAMYQAAISGNVTAIQLWMQRKEPSDRLPFDERPPLHLIG